MSNIPEQSAQHHNQDFDRATQHISSHISNDKDRENVEHISNRNNKINLINIDFDNKIINVKPEKNQKKKQKNRCVICKKKVGMLGFKCKCSDEHLFCSAHRLPESHECTFDHHSEEKEMLASKLVKVVSEKIQRI